MQFAIPVAAMAALVVSVIAALGLVAATALFAGALAVTRAEDVSQSLSPRS